MASSTKFPEIPGESLTGEYDFEFRALAHAVAYRKWIGSTFEPFLQGRVLEIGCGVGQFTEHLVRMPRVAQIDSVELDPALAAQFAVTDPKVALHGGTAQQFFEPDTFDAAISINVLEHIEQDEEELRHYARILKPGVGHLCILVPARPELYSPIDKKFGHWRRYTATDLREKLDRAGFEPVFVRYFNLVGYFTWLVVFRAMGSLTFTESSMKTFDRYVVPVARALDRAGLRPVGQSVVAVATPKPRA